MSTGPAVELTGLPGLTRCQRSFCTEAIRLRTRQVAATSINSSEIYISMAPSTCRAVVTEFRLESIVHARTVHMR